MPVLRGHPAVLVLVLLLAGCGPRSASEPLAPAAGASSPDAGLDADLSILFVGNSHTSYHNLPNLVADMIRFRHPKKTVHSQLIGMAFLEDAARMPQCRQELESRPWNAVVLQAQKISSSGRFDYSRTEGIELAKQAKARGAAVFFFAEWGRKDVAGEGPRTEKIYQEMAAAAGVGVAPVGRAWDVALAERPGLPLHAADGNHESAVGAFLTACVLYGRLTGESPAGLASFPWADITEADRRFLAAAAARALAADAAPPRAKD